MSGPDAKASAASTCVKLIAGEFSFQGPGRSWSVVSCKCVERSALLTDMQRNSADSPAEARVPLFSAALQRWLKHFEDGGSTYGKQAIQETFNLQDGPASGVAADIRTQDLRAGLDSMRDACALILAADVLIDEVTKADCAHDIAHLLQASWPQSEVAVCEEFEALPEAIQLVILPHIPLALCFAHLPLTLHPLALRAHVPSADAHHALHLPPLPPALLSPGLRAAAALTHLLGLHLSGATQPPDAVPPFDVITHLTALTSLTCRDIHLSPPAAAAVAAALPSLTRLLCLDLSSNLIGAPAMRALAPAVALTTSLHTLDLSSTLPRGTDGSITAADLGQAVAALTHLTSFAVGTWGGYKDSAATPEAGRWHTGLLHNLQGLSSLSDLQLNIDGGRLFVEEAERVAVALARLPQLLRLHLTVPPLWSAPLDEGHAQWQRQHVGESRHDVLAYGIRCLTRLTSLSLDFSTTTTTSSDDVSVIHAAAAAMFASLPTLHALQQLSLRLPIRCDHEVVDTACAALAASLPALAHLTDLRLRAGQMDAYGTVVADPGAASVLAVVTAALRLPRLRSLHVPVSVVCGGHERVVATLTGATHVDRLSLDLFVRTGATEDPAAHLLDAYRPLLPFTASADVWCQHTDILQALTERAAAMPWLRALTIETGTVLQHGLGHMFECLSCLGDLEELQCLVLVSDGDAAEPAFGASLGRLRSLTSLKWGVICVSGASVPLPGVFLQTVSSLTRLQVLDLDEYTSPEHHALCMAQLPLLRLAVLEAKVSSMEHVGRLAELVRRLQHLRRLRVDTGGSRHAECAAILHDATAALPAFQFLDHR